MSLSHLPITSSAPDQLREGIGAVVASSSSSSAAAAGPAPHPVALIDAAYARQADANQKSLLARVYGSHLPMKMHMEQTVLSQFRRAPGLPSSLLGLSVAMGRDEDIDWGDVHNRPENSEAHYDAQSEMENRMTGATKRRVF